LEEEKEDKPIFDLRGMKFDSIFEKFNKLSPRVPSLQKDNFLKK